MRGVSSVMRITVLLALVISTESQKFHPCYLKKLFIHATWDKLQKLTQGLNSDTTLAKQKARITSWSDKNFGTIKSKSSTLYDNKKYAVKRAHEYIEMRSNLKKLWSTIYKPELTKKLSAGEAKKLNEIFWKMDHYHLGINPDGAFYSLKYGIPGIVSPKNEEYAVDCLSDITFQTSDKNPKLYQSVYNFRLQDQEYFDDLIVKQGRS